MKKIACVNPPGIVKFLLRLVFSQKPKSFLSDTFSK